MSNLTIAYQPIEALKPREHNPRTHSKRQLRQLANSVSHFGFLCPVLVDGDNRIVAGHGRVEAAKLKGLKEVPTICVAHLSEAQIRAYVIADNKLAMNAEWNTELLRSELQQLSVEHGFDVTLTGFETAELDILLGTADDELDEADQVPEIDRSQPAVSRLNDLWRIGKHFVSCADATKSGSYDRLLQGQKADLVFTDPPYNVPIDGHVSGLGRNHHREFAMASGEMTEGEFTEFLKSVFRNLAAFSTDGSLHYVCMDWRHMWEVMAAGRKAYTELKNLCVWNKTNGGMGSLYRSKHELVFLFKNGKAPHVNNVELGKHERYRTNVWDYAGVNTFRANRDEELAAHPTVKPVRMVADAIRDTSNRKAIILDAFAGSGTTLVAAEQTGRRGYGLELDPHYVDVVVRRMTQTLGEQAVLANSNESFDEIARWRATGIE